jgi:hypothetical protein
LPATTTTLFSNAMSTMSISGEVIFTAPYSPYIFVWRITNEIYRVRGARVTPPPMASPSRLPSRAAAYVQSPPQCSPRDPRRASAVACGASAESLRPQREDARRRTTPSAVRTAPSPAPTRHERSLVKMALCRPTAPATAHRMIVPPRSNGAGPAAQRPRHLGARSLRRQRGSNLVPVARWGVRSASWHRARSPRGFYRGFY